ncbi:MAG TPA: hypothetical protein GX528_05425 [Firmicutes bacterium]|nr:hypothetical protein [Bacillota bacterium]
MNKKHIRNYFPLFGVSRREEQDELEKVLALEYHPRQRQRILAAPSLVFTTETFLY